MTDKDDSYNTSGTEISSDTVKTHGTTMGTVKWFNHSRGYGFITTINTDGPNNDYFVHHTNIDVKSNVYKNLQKGEYVHFNVKIEDNKYFAINVTGINGGPLLCEISRSRSKNKHGKQS